MIIRTTLFTLSCGLLLVCAGCCSPGRGLLCGSPCGVSYGPDCGGGGDCGSCPTPCGDSACGSDCDDASPCGPCGSCGGPCSPCYRPLWWFRPGKWIVGLLTCPTWCGPSCGECYKGEWYNDPPACQEPCDRGGNYVGSGCANCNGGHGGARTVARPSQEDAEIVPDETAEPEVVPAPTPAMKPQSTSQRPHKTTRRMPTNQRM